MSKIKKDRLRMSASSQASIEALNRQTIGRYEVVKKVGQGATGDVFLAKDPYIKRQVALKVSKPTPDVKEKAITKYRERFFSEAQSAGSLSHPNIVSIFDVGIHKDSCYIAMEYIEGSTLAEVCDKDALMPIEKLAPVIYHLCSALDYAHQKNVVHLDIKPANVLFTQAGDVKVTDFGIARVMSDQTIETDFAGSPSYMSPEQIQEHATDHLSDIFSLGAVVYEMLTGEQAFGGSNHFSVMYKVINTDPEPMSNFRQDIPPVLERIVNKALAKSPEDRYQSCMDFAYELRVAIRELSDHSPVELIADDILSYIQGIEFFEGFSKQQVQQILEASNVIRIGGGQVMVSEGDIDDSFYIILSGRATVRRKGRDIALIKRGECFGEMAFLSGESRTATVAASTDCTLLKISRILLEKSPEDVQLLFLKRFSLTLLRRLSLSNIQIEH